MKNACFCTTFLSLRRFWPVHNTMFLFDVEKERKRKKPTFTTVHQRADALRYIDELAKNRVGKFTTIDKANAISECEKFDPVYT